MTSALKVMSGLALLAVVFSVAVCGGSSRRDASEVETEAVSGRILDIEARSLMEIGKLIIEDEDGTAWVFGEQRHTLAAFPPSHLREHMVLGQPVTVTFHRENGELVIDRITD